MLSVLSLVVPVFGLIGLGFATAKVRWIEPAGARVLAEFGYKVAMPALLFRAMSSVSAPAVTILDLLGTYMIAITATWLAASIATVVLLRRPAMDAPSVAMSACFGNGVMLGIPLILGAFGEGAATVIASLVTVETLYLWVLATLHMQVASRGIGSVSLRALATILRDVALNPIVASIVIGLAWAASGFTMPALPDKLITLVAQAAVPVSLFALGMSLETYGIAGQLPTLSLIIVLKMVCYPIVAFLLGVYIFQLPPLWIGALLIFTSMPVGANAFVFASRYERAIGSVSAAVAVSSVISVITVTIILTLLQMAGYTRGL